MKLPVYFITGRMMVKLINSRESVAISDVPDNEFIHHNKFKKNKVAEWGIFKNSKEYITMVDEVKFRQRFNVVKDKLSNL